LPAIANFEKKTILELTDNKREFVQTESDVALLCLKYMWYLYRSISLFCKH